MFLLIVNRIDDTVKTNVQKRLFMNQKLKEPSNIVGKPEKAKHAGGCPRSISPPPNDMIELGKEMIQWLNENPGTLHLSEWYTIHKGYIYKQWKTFIQKEEFIPYYEQALRIVGKKYLDKTSNVRDSISHRWQRVYFKDVKEEEDETAAYNSSLRSKENALVSEEDVVKLDAYLKQLKEVQSSIVELKQASSNSKAE
jgi:hypothetical protein